LYIHKKSPYKKGLADLLRICGGVITILYYHPLKYPPTFSPAMQIKNTRPTHNPTQQKAASDLEAEQGSKRITQYKKVWRISIERAVIERR
jgi:hypothetical protein